jgi:hypothetical protein
MDCCATEKNFFQIGDEAEIDIRTKCASCAGVSRFVKKQTMLLMLKPEFFDQIGDGQYYYCADPGCEIVYFPETEGACFYTNHLRVRVGAKEKQDPKPLCYCFGFDEADFRDEIKATGQATISARIVKMVKAGMCACDTRNPSGACCLGDITKTVKRLQLEFSEK